MTTKLNDVIASELQRRVRKLSTPELMALVKDVPVKRKASQSGTHRLGVLPAPEAIEEEAPPSGHMLTIAEAIKKVAADAKRPLSSSDLVVGTQALRPDAQEPTIRAGISKLASSGELIHSGPRVGGVYEAPRVTKRAANG